MNFLCPSCRTPLPRGAVAEAVTCSGCGVAVDLTRVETAPGQARLWPEVDLSGEALGGYRLQTRIGSGGMGTVYDALAADGARVALKVLAPLLAAEPALRERFHREARALEALKHPGVVRLLAEGEERGFCWYAMEHVDGVDLRERLKSGPLPVGEVKSLAISVLDALEAVHAAGFVHRDVKPSNILLSKTGPRLCDFGIARLEGANTLTESAAVLGSLRYMSPEQRWGKSDARSDLYSLGVVLHEALALGVPGEKELPKSTPSSLVRLIARLTAAAPAKRPESAADAKRLLSPTAPRSLMFGVLAALLVAGVGAFWSQSADELVVTPVVDAGVSALEVVVDAGLAAPQSVVDAGVEPVDAGLEVPDVVVPKPLIKSPLVKKVTKRMKPLPSTSVTLEGPPARLNIDGRYWREGPTTVRLEWGERYVVVQCGSPKSKSGVKSKRYELTLTAEPQTLRYECP